MMMVMIYLLHSQEVTNGDELVGWLADGKLEQTGSQFPHNATSCIPELTFSLWLR